MLEFAVLVVQMNHCLPPKLTIAVISRMDYSLRTTLMPSCHDQNAALIAYTEPNHTPLRLALAAPSYFNSYNQIATYTCTE